MQILCTFNRVNHIYRQHATIMHCFWVNTYSNYLQTTCTSSSVNNIHNSHLYISKSYHVQQNSPRISTSKRWKPNQVDTMLELICWQSLVYYTYQIFFYKFHHPIQPLYLNIITNDEIFDVFVFGLPMNQMNHTLAFTKYTCQI